MTWLIVCSSVLGALLVTVFVATVYFFRYAIFRNDRYTTEAALSRMERTTPPEQFAVIKDGIECFLKAPKQDVFITSRDGLRLHGFLMEQPDSEKTRGTILLVHGWRSHPEIDFSASWRSYLEKGLNVLAIEQRAHSGSEGKYICFGIKERFDVLDWLTFITKRYGDDHKVVISGVSMGAATVLMAAGEAELPKNVVGVTADCGFVSPWAQFEYILRRSYHLPNFPLLYTTDLFSRAVADFPFRGWSTKQSLKNAKIPVLMLHGLADEFVPPEHSRRSAAACASPCELLEVEDAGHGMSYLVDPDTVKEKLDAFFESVLA